jgi:hypothetical protein
VGGQTPFVFRAEDVGLEHRDVEEDLEAGHLHFQRKKVILAHHHNAQQIYEAFSQREGFVFAKVKKH